MKIVENLDPKDVKVIAFSDHVSCRLPLAHLTETGGVMVAATIEADRMSVISDSSEDGKPIFNLNGFWIARVIVPEGHRGKGAGSILLDTFVALMDQQQEVCFLAPNSYGSLKQERLVEWYERRGFKEDVRFSGLYIRQPKPPAVLVLTQAASDDDY